MLSFALQDKKQIKMLKCRGTKDWQVPKLKNLSFELFWYKFTYKFILGVTTTKKTIIIYLSEYKSVKHVFRKTRFYWLDV